MWAVDFHGFTSPEALLAAEDARWVTDLPEDRSTTAGTRPLIGMQVICLIMHANADRDSGS